MCGVQNSPPGSALLALHARVADVTRDRIDHLVGEEKSLLQSWCMRGAPFCFPTVDAPVFTTGVLPATETARMHLIVGIDRALRTLGMGLDQAVDIVAEEIGAVLSGRQLAINELVRNWPSASRAHCRPPDARSGRRRVPTAGVDPRRRPEHRAVTAGSGWGAPAAGASPLHTDA